MEKELQHLKAWVLLLGIWLFVVLTYLVVNHHGLLVARGVLVTDEAGTATVLISAANGIASIDLSSDSGSSMSLAVSEWGSLVVIDGPYPEGDGDAPRAKVQLGATTEAPAISLRNGYGPEGVLISGERARLGLRVIGEDGETLSALPSR